MSLFLYYCIFGRPTWASCEKLFFLLFLRANLNECSAAQIFLKSYSAQFKEEFCLESFLLRGVAVTRTDFFLNFLPWSHATAPVIDAWPPGQIDEVRALIARAWDVWINFSGYGQRSFPWCQKAAWLPTFFEM